MPFLGTFLRSRSVALLSGAFVTVLSAANLLGQATSLEPRQFTSKSAYTLFSPTPRDMMRELAADRPDTTESPFTVDAGHYQFELSFAEWRKEGGSEELAILPGEKA